MQLDWFNTARTYWRSAEHLKAAALKVTHPAAPVTFLFCHAIELYLKAYLRGLGSTVAQLKKAGHRVADLAKSAAESGLRLDLEQSDILSHIDDADVAIEARYIVTGFTNRPTNDALSSVAEQLDRTVCAALTKRGFPVRAEQFARPDTQHQSEPKQHEELETDTVRVLVYLFGVDEIEDRGVGAIAKALRLGKGILNYHLDRLQEASFADQASADDLDVYWAISPQGRQYVVRRRLV